MSVVRLVPVLLPAVLLLAAPEAPAADCEITGVERVVAVGDVHGAYGRLAKILRADPATAAVPLVAVSGYAQDEDRRNARAAGFDALLAKPADTDELVQLLSRQSERGA